MSRNLLPYLLGGVSSAAPTVVGGVQIGSAGGNGTIYDGFKLVWGDDFNSVPAMWDGSATTGKYATSPPYLASYTTSYVPSDGRRFHYYEGQIGVEPNYSGYRHSSPTPLGLQPFSVSNSVLTITADAIPAPAKPYMPNDWGGYGTSAAGDGSGYPRAYSGTVCSWPDFMFSAKGDFIIEIRQEMSAASVHSYWTGMFTLGAPGLDAQEFDGPEVTADTDGTTKLGAYNIFGSLTDGGANSTVVIGSAAVPTARMVQYVVRKIGTTLTVYDDIATPGTLALRYTYTNARLARARFAQSLIFGQWINVNASGFTMAEYPATYKIDWIRCWTPLTATNTTNRPMNVVSTINTVSGGSWTATIPNDATLWGSNPVPDVVQISIAQADSDVPGGSAVQASSEPYLPGGMTVNYGARTITGTIPSDWGGRVGLLFMGSYDNGGPVARAMMYWNVAPVVKPGLLADQSINYSTAFNDTIDYTDFHSGNLGPHTYSVSKVSGGSWLTITPGAGNYSVTLSGTTPGSDETTVLAITATNAIGQQTTVNRTLTTTAVVTTATFNPSDKNSRITLTGSNLIATMGAGSVYAGVRSTTSKSSGKYYVEFKMTVADTYTAIGIANANQGIADTDNWGATNNAIAVYLDNATGTYLNNSLVNNFHPNINVNNDILCMAVDFTAKKLWWRKNNGQWQGTTDDPATGTGGISFATMAAGPYFFGFDPYANGAQCTLQAASSSWTYSAPSGFGQWT